MDDNKKCGFCTFKAIEAMDFIEHYKAKHSADKLKILHPKYDQYHNKRKYEVLKYDITAAEIGERCVYFNEDLVLKEEEKEKSMSPELKRPCFMSTPIKYSDSHPLMSCNTHDCKHQIEFDEGDETIAYEHDTTDDLSLGIKSLYIHQQTQTEDIYSKEFDSELVKEMYELIPAVCLYLSKAEPLHKERFIQMLKLMASGDFPLWNICYMLFLDVVQWYSASSTCQMRYTEEVRHFWYIGKQLFHGKFIQFMRGTGNAGQVVSGRTSPGYFNPKDSNINFAVPSEIYACNSSIPDSLYPGLLTTMIDSYIEKTAFVENKSFNLSVDLKKINANKLDELGCIDLSGFEKSPTKIELEKRMKYELSVTATATKLADEVMINVQRLSQFPEMKKEQLLYSLQELIRIQGTRVEDLRKYLIGKEYALKKLLEKASLEKTNDWKLSKFAFAISFIKTNVIQTKECIQQLLETVNKTCAVCAELNQASSLFARGDSVDLSRQGNYVCMTGLDSSDIERLQLEVEDVSTKLQQKSDAWFKLREKAKFTGSTANSALGLGRLKDQKIHFQHVFLKQNRPEPDNDVQARMKYGTDNEINALGTLLTKVLPCYYPQMLMKEVGSYVLNQGCGLFGLASPDGEGWHGTELQMTFEFKCPFPNKSFATPVFYDIPAYYVPQILSQMNLAPKTYDRPVDECIFLCWSEQSSTAFLIKNDKKLWSDMMEEMIDIYGKEKPILPRKQRPSAVILKDKIGSFLKQNVQFMGEFPSVKALKCHHVKDGCIDPNEIHHCHAARTSIDAHTVLDLQILLECTRKHIQDAALLTRPRATDVMVIMLSDLDRTKTLENTPLAIPVYYGLSGKSLSMETTRNVMGFVRNAIESKGLHIITQGFDGQMAKLAITDEHGERLTLLQEQKHLWIEACKTTKGELVKKIMSHEMSADSKDDSVSTYSCELFPDIETFDENTTKQLHDFDRLISDSISSISQLFEHTNSYKWSQEQKTILKKMLSEDLGKSSNAQNTRRNIGNKDNEMIADHISSVLNEQGNLIEQEALLDACLADLHDSSHINSDDAIGYASISEHNNVFDTCVAHEAFNTPDNDMSDHDEREDEEEIVEVQDSIFQAASVDEMPMLLMALQTSSTKLSQKWCNVPLSEFRSKFENANIINKSFIVDELKILVKTLRAKHSANYPVERKALHYKADYVNILSTLIGDQSQLASKEPKKLQQKLPLTLKSLLTSKIKKVTLNVIFCILEWPRIIMKWRSSSLFEKYCKVADIPGHLQWFTQPEHLGMDKPLFSLLDFHHLLTNTRCHIARKGYHAAGIEREAWLKIARDEKNNKTGLNMAFVEDVIDPQSNSVAKLFFSEKVQKEMEKNDDLSEASFCNIIRDWYAAVDERGLPALNRVEKLLKCRSWLLDHLIPGLVKFPPPASHICDIPIVTFEGLLLSTERIVQMYSHARGGTFNVRALGSQMNETFFSSFRDLDARGAGVLTPAELPKAMSVSCQLLEARLDPDRPFCLSTTRRIPVYPSHTAEQALSQITEFSSDESTTEGHSIILQDHPSFDVPARQKSRQKVPCINPPEASAHGSQGIRQYHRRDEEKVLYHKRAGYNIN